MASAAQDEFNELMRDKSRPKGHPADSVRDNTDAASFLDDNSSEDDNTSSRAPRQHNKSSSSAPPQGLTQQQGHYTVPTQRHQSNTGPKGVITDAQAYRAAARTHARAATDNMSKLSLQKERETHISSTQPYISSGLGRNGDGRHDDNDVEDEADNDDGFMDQWRQNRLQELQGQGGKSIGGSGRERAARRLHFGGLVPVDGPGYLDVVDGSGSVTVVVVFIYDDQSEVSGLIEGCVADLARKWVNTRFVKLHYQDAEMEPAGVPAVLAYRGGDKFAGLVPVVDEIPDDADVTPETLEKLFQRHQIL